MRKLFILFIFSIFLSLPSLGQERKIQKADFPVSTEGKKQPTIEELKKKNKKQVPFPKSKRPKKKEGIKKKKK